MPQAFAALVAQRRPQYRVRPPSLPGPPLLLLLNLLLHAIATTQPLPAVARRMSTRTARQRDEVVEKPPLQRPLHGRVRRHAREVLVFGRVEVGRLRVVHRVCVQLDGHARRLDAKVRHTACLVPRVPLGESPADHADRESHDVDPAVRLHVGRAPSCSVLALAVIVSDALAEGAQHHTALALAEAARVLAEGRFCREVGGPTVRRRAMAPVLRGRRRQRSRRGQQVAREAPSVDVGLHGHAGELAQGTVNVDQLDETVVPPPAPARRPPPVAYYERDARGELGVGLLAPVAMLAQMPA